MQALLSDGGSPEDAREDRRCSNAGAAQSGDSAQAADVEAACDTALQQGDEQQPRQKRKRQALEFQPHAASSPPHIQKALSDLSIHTAWLPLLQRAPPAALLVQSLPLI